jgi:hypothetical protein
MTSPTEIKKYREENLRFKQQIEQRSGKTAAQLYDERSKRIRDAVELRVPDRVPFTVFTDVHAYAGIPNSADYYDPMAFKRANRQIAVDLAPDMGQSGFPSCGDAMTALDVKNVLWPGGPLPPNYGFQAVEGEYMKAEEYDIFLNDFSDFVVRYYLPRIYGALAPLAKLPPLQTLHQGFDGLTTMFASPEFQEMAKRLAEAGRHTEQFRKIITETINDLEELGFPPFAKFVPGAVGGAPFDTLTSSFRGMKGSMVDMYRRPEKLLKACEAIIDRKIARAIPADKSDKDYPTRVAMPLWRGDPNFMSEEHFKKFYWPGLKKSLQVHIDLGYVPVPFFEAPFGERLKYLQELPAGKMIAGIHASDAAIAKKYLGDRMCLMVNCPNTTKLWTLNQLDSFLRDMVKVAGKKGGLIMLILMPDNAPVKDMQALLKSFEEYSRY